MERIDRIGRMRRRAGASQAEYVTELLVGERRVHERTALEAWLSQWGSLAPQAFLRRPPAFLVATSAGEVGVDLNAEHMVCDLVAYERMVQRLGRVQPSWRQESHGTCRDVRSATRREGNDTERARTGREGPHVIQPAAGCVARVVSWRRRPSRCKPRSVRGVEVESSRHHRGGHDRCAAASRIDSAAARCVVDDVAAATRRPSGSCAVAAGMGARGRTANQRRGGGSISPMSALQNRHPLVEPAAVAEYFRTAPVHASERLQAPASRVLDWLLSRIAALDKHAHPVEPAVRDDDIGVMLIDHTGELVGSVEWNELRHLAAPAKRLSKTEQRQRDRRKHELRDRHLPGSTLVVDARISGLRDGMLDARLISRQRSRMSRVDGRSLRATRGGPSSRSA